MTEPMEFTDDTTALYRLWDAADGLLSVGRTYHPRMRFDQHAAEKPWWPEVARKTVVWYGTLADAKAAENEAIEREKPRHNGIPAAGAKRARHPELIRVEGRLRPEQLADLEALARTLNRNRHGRGGRITANTLIRVAMALVLEREKELTGATEDELRQSLGLD
jgi:hypothetical protein